MGVLTAVFRHDDSRSIDTIGLHKCGKSVGLNSERRDAIVTNKRTGALINCLGLGRAVVCSCNDRKWAKSPLWLVFFLVCYAVSPLLTWDGPHCLLLGGAMMMTTVALWVHDMRLTRLLFLLNSPLVLLYNLIARSYSCAAIEVVALASFALAVWRFDIHKQLCKS